MDTGPLVALLLLGALAAAAAGWVRRLAAAAIALAGLALGGLALAALLAAASGPVDSGRGQVTLFVVLAGALAVAGGGPVTSRVFALVDGRGHGDDPGSMNRAGEVLRGGAWIGALERAAIFASLATAQPEGVAIVLGL